MTRRRHRNPKSESSTGDFIFGAVVGFGTYMLALQAASTSGNSTLTQALEWAGPGIAGYLVGGGAGVLGALAAQAATVFVAVQELKNIG